MQTILTAVERQQGTTAATLIRRGQKESGAIRPIQTRDGTHATFHSAVLSMVGQSISAYNVYFFQKKIETHVTFVDCYVIFGFELFLSSFLICLHHTFHFSLSTFRYSFWKVSEQNYRYTCIGVYQMCERHVAIVDALHVCFTFPIIAAVRNDDTEATGSKIVSKFSTFWPRKTYGRDRWNVWVNCGVQPTT